MSKMKLYETLRQVWFKFLSNLVSFKYQTGVAVTVAFFLGLLPWYAWLPALMAIASIRGYEKFLIWGKRTPDALTEEPVLPVEEPEVD